MSVGGNRRTDAALWIVADAPLYIRIQGTRNPWASA